MFEPIGGSAPKYRGKNMINPLAAISACQMMLEHLGEGDSSTLIEKAVIETLVRDMKSLSAGDMGCGTTDVGDLVVKYLAGFSG